MSDKKIAESIIIRVGGGIREVPREISEDVESLESVSLESLSATTGFAPVTATASRAAC